MERVEMQITGGGKQIKLKEKLKRPTDHIFLLLLCYPNYKYFFLFGLINRPVSVGLLTSWLMEGGLGSKLLLT
jgi:hypothetical protein